MMMALVALFYGSHLPRGASDVAAPPVTLGISLRHAPDAPDRGRPACTARPAAARAMSARSRHPARDWSAPSNAPAKHRHRRRDRLAAGLRAARPPPPPRRW